MSQTQAQREKRECSVTRCNHEAIDSVERWHPSMGNYTVFRCAHHMPIPCNEHQPVDLDQSAARLIKAVDRLQTASEQVLELLGAR